MKVQVEWNPEGGWDVVDAETYEILASEPTKELAAQSARQIRQEIRAGEWKKAK